MNNPARAFSFCPRENPKKGGFRVTRLRFERQNKRLSQTGLVIAAGIPQPTVSHIEIGRLRPTPAQLQRLAQVLHVAPEDLLVDVAVLGPSR
jgi:transcriptional regulator with XRE-family HTH domain